MTIKFSLSAAIVITLLSVINVLAQTNSSAKSTQGEEIIESNQKHKDTQRLIEILGLKNNAKSTLPRMVAALKPQLPQVPDKFWHEFQSESNLQKCIGFYVEAYNKYFTHEDIKGMIKFYSSPLGQKIVATTPQLMQEIMDKGEKWGIDLQKQAVSESPTNASLAKEISTPSAVSPRKKFSAAQKRWMVKASGFDPDKWDATDDGTQIFLKPPPSPIVPALKFPQESQPDPTPIPQDVHYLVQYGEMMCYCKDEPKPYGSGYKFKIYPSDIETTYSGNIQITKIK